MEKGEIRAKYSALTDSDTYIFTKEPSCSAPYEVGVLDEERIFEALQHLNWLRWLAGLEEVGYSRVYAMYAQHGAVLLAANDTATHTPGIAPGMTDDFYSTAYTGTTSGNLVRYSWFNSSIITEALDSFVMDNGNENLSHLGHRRWLLNPCMAQTGFGAAESKAGNGYVLMYAVDFAADASWVTVAWPASGAFPAEYIETETPWSLSLNPEKFASEQTDVIVSMTETVSGASFRLHQDSYEGGYCRYSAEPYGSGGCVIFRPDIAQAGLEEYTQNQIWHVEISGLTRSDGSSETVVYDVEMISLTEILPVNVEISALSMAMKAGDTASLSADVIPLYADDISVIWISSDPSVATVDEHGTVAAVGPGTCGITARSVNGREDTCAVTVYAE